MTNSPVSCPPRSQAQVQCPPGSNWLAAGYVQDPAGSAKAQQESAESSISGLAYARWKVGMSAGAGPGLGAVSVTD